MTMYQRMKNGMTRAALALNKSPDPALTPGIAHARSLFTREAIFARPKITVRVVEKLGTIRREFRATTDVDDRSYEFHAPYAATAVQMAHVWALYTYGREALITVEVR